MHSRFEELCALAATGQISGDAMQLLDQHVKQCDECRMFLQDLVPLKAHVAPVLAATHARTGEVPDCIRERFLQRAAAAGLNLQPGPALAVSDVSQPVRSFGFEAGFRGSWTTAVDWMRARSVAVFRVTAPVGAAALCVLAGYFASQQRLSDRPTSVVISSPSTPAPAIQSPTPSVQVANLNQDRAEAQKHVDQLSSELVQLNAENRQLISQLSEAAQKAEAGARFEQQFKDEAQKLQDNEDRLLRLQAELDEEREKRSASEAILIAQQQATLEANEKLASLQTHMEQERQLSSARSVAADMIAARNLHIVDVYDTESTGERKRAFGRVFYVEGQSLVFYAYDLARAKHPNTKITFRVWGETAGVKAATTYNLGILRSDDPGQERWKLSFEDPKVLSRINAVYITADPHGSPRSEPTGRKLMYAFLGSANHP